MAGDRDTTRATLNHKAIRARDLMREDAKQAERRFRPKSPPSEGDTVDQPPSNAD